MTLAQYVMLAAAILSALAWRWNATSAALAFGYLASQVWWLIAGACDAGALFMIDVSVIALIFCKAIARCPEVEFRDGWDQLRCFLRSPTPRDWIVLGIFPVAWMAYTLTIPEYERWWCLYWAAMVQFAVAGSEAFTERRRAKASSSEPDTPPSGLMFAAARAGRWST